MRKKENNDLLIVYTIAFIIVLLNTNPLWAYTNKKSFIDYSNSDALEITLEDSIHETLKNNYFINTDQENIVKQKGNYLKEKGIFDWNIIFQLKGSYLQNELTPRELNIEKVKRELLDCLSEETHNMAESNDSEDTEIIDIYKDVINNTYSKNISTRSIDNNASKAIDYNQDKIYNNIIDDWNVDSEDKLLLGSFYSNIEETCEELALGTEECYRYLSEAYKQKLNDLGEIPKASIRIEGIVKFGVKKFFRNGILLYPRISIQGSSYQFKDKPRALKYGGTGKDDTYKSNIGLEINIPVGKKNASVVTSSLEKMAKYNLDSARHKLENSKRKSILQTIILYWKLLYYQKRIKVLQKEINEVKEIVKVTKQLKNIGAKSETDLTRASANYSSKQSQFYYEKQKLFEVQAAFSENTGIFFKESLLFASDQFPEVNRDLRNLELDYLIKKAFQNRHDYRQLLALQKSARIQLNASNYKKFNEKYINISMFYQGKEENNSVFKGLEGVVFKDLTGPSILATFNMQIPYRNHVARSDYLQSKSLLNKINISIESKEKEIAGNIKKLYRSFNNIIQKIYFCDDSLNQYMSTYKDYKKTYKRGSYNKIDLLKINNYLTDAKMEKIKTQYEYAEILTHLKFEIGFESIDIEKSSHIFINLSEL